MKKIFLCAISNVASGNCAEDCQFCTQSAYFDTGITTYKYKDANDVLNEAKLAYKNQAVGFCLVTSGKGITDKKLEYISSLAHKIKKEIPDINLIACNGLASVEQLKYLKSNGIDSYNHNLETSKEFYNTVCTSHPWEDRYQTCLNVKEAELMLCSGGIFGLGESDADRKSLINSIVSLEPMSVPINFYHPNDALPIKASGITKQEAQKMIAKVATKLPNTMLMIAGGRELVFKDDLKSIFESGANSIVIGNYLTTEGESSHKDLELIKNNGYEIATIEDCPSGH